MTYLKKILKFWAAAFLYRSKMKKWDLQNNFDLSYLLMSNVSIERMCKFFMLNRFYSVITINHFY